MKILRQFGLILVILLAGEFCSKVLKVPLPGSVIGMILLFILLSIGIIKVEMIEELSYFLLNNLAFFFVPLGVGLLRSLNIIKGNGLKILLIVVVTTFLVTAVTGLCVQAFTKGRDQ